MAEELDDFYEDDEPLEKIVAIFERGEKGTTQRSTMIDECPPKTQLSQAVEIPDEYPDF